MKCEAKVFIVGVGPGELPFISVHGAALLGRAGRVLLDSTVPEALHSYVSAQCASQIKQEPLFLSEIPVKKEGTCRDLFDTQEDIVWLQSVPSWGAPLFVPAFLENKTVILESLPALDSDASLLVVEGKKAFRMKSQGLHSDPAQKKKRGLSAQRVIVTRAKAQSDSFVRELTLRGARAIEIPSIRIEPHPDREGIVEAIAGLNAYDWVIFSSTNGVDMFFELFFRRFQDMRDFGGARIAAVGPATAARLSALHLQVDVVPKIHTGKEIAKAIDQFDALENRKILLVRPEKGSADLPRMLEDEGAIVDDIPFYCTVSESPEAMENEALQREGADWITFCSPSAVEHFHAQHDLFKLLKHFPAMKIASIGPETTNALSSMGLTVTVEAAPHTVPALIEAMEKHEFSLQS